METYTDEMINALKDILFMLQNLHKQHEEAKQDETRALLKLLIVQFRYIMNDHKIDIFEEDHHEIHD